jgi:hypothetical protein
MNPEQQRIAILSILRIAIDMSKDSVKILAQ